MADPHHVPILDAFDIFTVRLYRSGLVIAALGLVGQGAIHLAGAAEWIGPLWVVIFAGSALSVADMHLYDKRIRWVIAAAGWLGGALMLLSAQVPESLASWVFHAGLGFVFVTFSGFALKEQFCFKIPFLRLVPIVLASSLLPLLAAQLQVAGAMLVVAGGMYGALAAAKLRMPIHYDIGDKSAYQT